MEKWRTTAKRWTLSLTIWVRIALNSLIVKSDPCFADDDNLQDDIRGTVDVQARLLYGLIHARWIVTARGLQKMVRKYTC